MHKNIIRIFAVIATLGFGSASAEEAAPIIRGTYGLAEVSFVAENKGPGAIGCSVALAHWYSVELGHAPSGGSVKASLWYDPKTGSLFLLNAIEDRMPVQALWCGFAEHAWATRSLVTVEHAAGRVPPPIHIACAPEGESLSCR